MKQDELMRGYVPVKNKKCIMPFKDRPANELLTYEQVSTMPEFAGILADSTVLVDVDDAEQADKLFELVKGEKLKCRVYATTRGKHFLFKNTRLDSCRTGWKLAVGITADIKLGCKNSYSVLKHNGEERAVLYDTEEYEPLPEYLVPVYKDGTDKTDFTKLEAGDGRNTALFAHILPLQKAGISVENAKEAITLLNEYILPSPLDAGELSVILRDSAFSKPLFFDSKNRFEFDKFARYVTSNYDVIKLGGDFHVYKDGIYVPGIAEVEKILIQEIPKLSQSQRTEVLNYMNLIVPELKKTPDAHLIAFKNGIYNVLEDRFEPPSPEYVITNVIPHNYAKNAVCDLVDNTLRKLACGDETIEKLLKQAVGYTFYRRNELRKSFMLIGDKRNGKSTFLDMICTMLGEENICNLDLAEIGDRFKTAEIVSKLANIGDDINDEWIPNAAIFKKVVSGERITVERKGQDPFKVTPYAKFFFSANAIPRIGKGKDSAAITDRMIVIPFEATFSKSDPDYDPYIKYKLRKEDAIERLIALGMEGLREVLENQEFAKSVKVDRELAEFEETNNPILGWLHETDANVSIRNQPVKHPYGLYKEYCLANNLSPLSNGEFIRFIKRELDFDVSVKRPIDSEKGCKCFVAKDI